MSEFIHYILVRRDLPFGVTLAQVAHAAAWSMDGIAQTTVAVLGVKNEANLRRLARKIGGRGIPHDCIYEHDEPWCGQLMAIGVCPGLRSKLAPHFKKLSTYRNYEGPQ